MDPSVDAIKCTYGRGGKQEENPHIHEPFRPLPKKIYDDMLDAVGNTPMIRLNKVGPMEDVHCQILAKCEFMNIGGSVKDRIGKRMVLDAEKYGGLQKGCKILEATSGNTGIALSLAAAVRGYEVVITMPEKMSAQKANVLKGLGAKIIRTPNQCAYDDPKSHISICKKLAKEDGYVLLDQYCNPSNPLAHYDQLAEEILYQCDGKVDAVVLGAGTGGTLTGVSRKIKQKSPHTKIVCVDPCGSILAMPQELNKGKFPMNKVEGIGYDFVPRTCDRQYVDHWIKTQDPESFTQSRRLISKEGLLVGGSAGSAMSGALRFIKEIGWENDKSKRVVCIFSDSIRNYITKFLSTEWCVENGFLPYEELNDPECIFNGMQLSQCKFNQIEAHEDLTIGEAKDLFERGEKIIPLKKQGEIFGAIFPKKFLQSINLKKLTNEDSALKTKTNEFVIVPKTISVSQLSKMLQRHDTVLLTTRNDKNQIEKLQVATPADLFKLTK